MPENHNAPFLLQQIQDESLDPGALTPVQRRDCVAHLHDQAFTTDQIAHVLSITTRSVRRYRAQLRRQGRLAPTLTLGDELLGEYDRIANDCIAQLKRLSQSPTTEPYAQLWATEAISRVYDRFMKMALAMNYLDPGTHRLSRQLEQDPAEIEHGTNALAKFLQGPANL